MEELLRQMKETGARIQLLEGQRKAFEIGISNDYGSRVELEKLRKQFRSLQIKHKKLWMQSQSHS